MIDTVPFIPGHAPVHAAPLRRYLPPLADGVVNEWLQQNVPPGSWVIDPFGASPRHTLEAARAGYRVLSVANNPVSKFLCELYASPPTSAMLQAALAELAFDPRTGEKLEQQIRAMYQTECESCGRSIDAQAFIWERDGNILAGKMYACPHCKDSGEHAASRADVDRLRTTSAEALHRARALERVAPLNDPERVFVEEAIAVYPGRALNALQKLVNRAERMSPEKRRLASALLLAAFDQANALWHHPPARFRPRQLSLPTRYLEKNIWLALEDGVKSWPVSLNEAAGGEGVIECTLWPNLPAGRAGVCIFPGHLRDLAAQIAAQPDLEPGISAVLGVLPRYNQAFWTLSALWAGWLWGRASIAGFRSVLRRRRYDWNWHLQALQASLGSLAGCLRAGVPVFGLIGEAEPMFLSSALLSAGMSGFELDGIALRSGLEQAQIRWKRSSRPERPTPAVLDPYAQVVQAISGCLARCGEPVEYVKVHAAALQAYVENCLPPSAQENAALEALRAVDAAIEQALRASSGFVQFSASARSIDAGQWWLSEQREADQKLAPPLADRVELAVLRILQKGSPIGFEEIDGTVCAELRGLLTPDQELVAECLRSYGLAAEAEGKTWQLRPQDAPDLRRQDLSDISARLVELGKRLGFETVSKVIGVDSALLPLVEWAGSGQKAGCLFHLITTGMLGSIILNRALPESLLAGSPNRIVVLPGGRAGLVEWKLLQNPRLRKALSRGWSLLKFRHIRWMAENESLTPLNLQEILKLDPLANQDPQMPLL